MKVKFSINFFEALAYDFYVAPEIQHYHFDPTIMLVIVPIAITTAARIWASRLSVIL